MPWRLWKSVKRHEPCWTCVFSVSLGFLASSSVEHRSLGPRRCTAAYSLCVNRQTSNPGDEGKRMDVWARISIDINIISTCICIYIYTHTQVCVYTCIYCLRSLPSKWLKRTDYANVHLLYLCVYTRSCDFTLPKERCRYGPKQRCTNDKKTLQKLNPCQCWTVSTFFAKLQATHHLPAPISSPLPPATHHLPYSDHGPWSPTLVLPAQ